ncbi:MAG: STAS domain-containing protein [Gammaproteobacteria bacterium]|nr:STAS domain-containing protein [Gammaproteobacteria bacterium]
MFEIDYGDDGEVMCSGRLDASQCAKAQSFMDEIADTRTLDFSGLEYISSAGLGILLKTQKRLAESGAALKITNVNNHIYDVFRYSGFNAIFDIKAKE